MNKLIKYLKANGWIKTKILDKGTGEEIYCFTKNEITHKVAYIPSNCPEDRISDWSYDREDKDGFNVLMDKFLDGIPFTQKAEGGAE